VPSGCQYLHSKDLRREIRDGLNVVEQWNGATNFVFFARRGEMASSRREDQGISMLSLHLIQYGMVYVNTLMIQSLPAKPHWQGQFTPRDYAALASVIWEHVNRYGRLDLHMNSWLALLLSTWRLVTRLLGQPLDIGRPRWRRGNPNAPPWFWGLLAFRRRRRAP